MPTKEGIMAQVWVAFGQGTGAVPVSEEACLELHALYYNAIDDKVLLSWGTAGAQVLERIRAIGRKAQMKATEAASNEITAEQVRLSAYDVEYVSDTDMCPPRPPV